MTLPLAFPKNRNTLVATKIPGPARTSLSTVASRKPRTLDASYLAHDARNWLTVLQVYCDLLRTSDAVASDQEKWIGELSGAVERGRGLVTSLLDSVEGTAPSSDQQVAVRKTVHPADAPDPGQDPGQNPGRHDRRWPAATVTAPLAEMTAPLDVAAAVSRRLPLLQRMAGSDIQVEIDAPANAGQVALTEGAFERILHNLVGNAIESMPHGGHLRISLRRGNRRDGNTRGARPAVERRQAASRKALKSAATTKGDRRASGTSTGAISKSAVSKTLLLRVHDTGDGIAPERLAHIFEAGVSDKAVREDDRLQRGLGLAIVRDLTQEAGGAVRVRSRPGRGTCFEIELPRI